MISEKLSGMVQYLRFMKKVSVSDLAAALGISQANLSHRLHGRIQWSLEDLVALSEFFGVSADYLLGRNNNGRKEDDDQ